MFWAPFEWSVAERKSRSKTVAAYADNSSARSWTGHFLPSVLIDLLLLQIRCSANFYVQFVNTSECYPVIEISLVVSIASFLLAVVPRCSRRYQFVLYSEFSGVCSSKPYTNLIRVHSSITVHWYKCFPFLKISPFRPLYGTSLTSICSFLPGSSSSESRLCTRPFFLDSFCSFNPNLLAAYTIPEKLRLYPLRSKSLYTPSHPYRA